MKQASGATRRVLSSSWSRGLRLSVATTTCSGASPRSGVVLRAVVGRDPASKGPRVNVVRRGPCPDSLANETRCSRGTPQPRSAPGENQRSALLVRLTPTFRPLPRILIPCVAVPLIKDTYIYMIEIGSRCCSRVVRDILFKSIEVVLGFFRKYPS